MGQKVTEFPKTTVRVPYLPLIQLHALKHGETFNRYINRLIKQDILNSGDFELIAKVVKELET